VTVDIEGESDRPSSFEFEAGRDRRSTLDEQPPAPLDLEEVLARQAAGAVLLDSREPAEFAAGHLRGAINVALQDRFAELAAAVLAADRDVVLVGDPSVALEAKVLLGRVGYDRVVGQLDGSARVFSDRPELIETSSRLTIEQLAELRGLEPDLQLVDVRDPVETAIGTLPGALEIPLAVLVDSLGGLDPTSPVVSYCATGDRSLIAASVLQEAGFSDVSDLLGGYGAWVAAGLPISTTGAEVSIGTTQQVGARAAKAQVDAGALLLDVREPAEWEIEHAPDALLMPMGKVPEGQGDLPRDRRIVVLCRSGGRSAAVTESLRARGFDAVNLAGGMCAWAAAGLPVVHEPPDRGGLVVHGTDPLNCETSIPALIGGVVMPNARFYVRNHFATPTIDPLEWRLAVHGLVERPLELSLRELHNMRSETLVATLECAGNGRSLFDPPVPGERWRLGAVSTAEWTGVPLVEVLDRAGPAPGAREVLFRGADSGTVEGSSGAIHFERSLTLDEARTCEVLLAYAMNGEPLPTQHGYPLRAIVPRWYAVASVKWLTDIELIDSAFSGFFQSQRYVYEWQRDGATDQEPVRLQRVRSLITEPTDDEVLPLGECVIRGVAWSGAAPIAKVEVSIADGPWQPAQLIGHRQPHSWQWWELLTSLEQPGVVTVRSRATDLAGRVQPEQPEWNRLGYGGNAIQPVAIRVE
jgi:DMSO/TMAO reductase YedYZ molybdopterin-dependent catalytic subunit/3-mercaptopyruvate sulfurtransferase SseA